MCMMQGWLWMGDSSLTLRSMVRCGVFGREKCAFAASWSPSVRFFYNQHCHNPRGLSLPLSRHSHALTADGHPGEDPFRSVWVESFWMTYISIKNTAIYACTY
jgi:hypothetical protein